jgi:protein involved in polysaccharide export with SLBB domain
MPRELEKVILPTYRIEPPDILMINAIHVVPRSPYYLRTLDVIDIQVQGLPDRLRELDVLEIEVPGALSGAPIAGAYQVGPGGLINMGLPYGSVRVFGMTVDEAKTAIEEHLGEYLKEPAASVALAAGAPIAGTYTIQLGCVVNLGLPYGSITVAGMTVEEAEQAIEKHLHNYLKEPAVSVTLVDIGAKQQIIGEHLVAPDGTVTLGSYGSVSVVGLTLAEARLAMEGHLSQFLEDPEVAVDVFAYNSKVYYIVTQGAGLGDGVYRYPITGNDTVLDAISQINGLGQVSSKRIWIARPTRQPGKVQVLPVSWDAITACGSPGTNYQLLPGDRVFVAEDKLIAFDQSLAKLTAPLERIMGFSLLGAGVATRFSGPVLRGGGNPRGNF